MKAMELSYECSPTFTRAVSQREEFALIDAGTPQAHGTDTPDLLTDV